MGVLRTRADGSTIFPIKHKSPADRDPNSKRSKRRANRNFKPELSRCNRRASQRLASQSTNPSLQASKPGFHEPGALKKW